MSLLIPGSHAQNDSPTATADVNGLIWALTTSSPIPWAEANEFCATLELAGSDDWRLPTLAELETLHDPDAEGSIRLPLVPDDCCAWSSQNAADIEPEQKGVLPPPGGPPSGYYWGFLFAGGVSYYSNGNFPDGFAMCLREPD